MRLQVGDVRLYFDVEGAAVVADGATLRERPTLVLLHGGPGFDHSTFKPWFGRLADTVQVVYLDHRGNGRSDAGPPGSHRLAQWGDDVRAFCDALGIERPIVLGASFGGFVAQAYATRHPDHPRALVLCSTAARHRQERVLAAFHRLGGDESRRAAAAYLRDPTPATLADYARLCAPLYTRRPLDLDDIARSLVRARPDVTMAFFGGEFRTFDFLEALGRVRCPTLVVAGEEDPITPVEDGEDLAAALPRSVARFERFPGCGHPVFLDDEDGFFRVLRDFLARV